jgi:hypothetical protein
VPSGPNEAAEEWARMSSLPVPHSLESSLLIG